MKLSGLATSEQYHTQRESDVAAPGDSAKDCRGSPSPLSPRTLLPMWSQREVIDYALQRRSTLQALRRRDAGSHVKRPVTLTLC